MTVKRGTATRNAMCDALVDQLDGGTITIRTGAPPTAPADADSGTLLGTLTFGTPAFGAASTGAATANAITSDSSADATGTAGHFRMKTSGGVVVLQGTVAVSGADLDIDSVSIVAGGVISCSSFVYTVGE